MEGVDAVDAVTWRDVTVWTGSTVVAGLMTSRCAATRTRGPSDQLVIVDRQGVSSPHVCVALETLAAPIIAGARSRSATTRTSGTAGVATRCVTRVSCRDR